MYHVIKCVIHGTEAVYICTGYEKIDNFGDKQLKLHNSMCLKRNPTLEEVENIYDILYNVGSDKYLPMGEIEITTLGVSDPDKCERKKLSSNTYPNELQ